MNIRKKVKFSGVLIAFLLLVSTIAFSQEMQFTGRVLEKGSEFPLPGVNIVIKGTTNGTVTDYDGNFSITVPDENATLAISYMGYLPLEIAVKGKSVLNIQLETDSKLIDDIVVVGYGVQKKSEVTGAIASVSGDDISGLPVAQIGQAIQGKVAGVQIVQNSGAPGTSLDIQIRGTGTINNSSPLYIVDGIIADDIDHIAPENIKSLEVLKDAAASAVYGARAANGVVLVTTRQGESGKTRISFGAYSAVQDYWKDPEVLDAYDYRVMNSIKSQNWESADDLINNQSIADYEEYDINWLDQISRQGVVQKYNLSVSGGSDKVKYLVSGNIFDNKGVIMKSDFSQKNLTFDVSADMASWAKVRMNVLYNDSEKNSVTQGQYSVIRKAIAQTPTVTMFNEEYEDGKVLNGSVYKDVVNANDATNTSNVDAKLFFDFTLRENLVLTSRGSFRRGTVANDKFAQRADLYDYAWGPDTQSKITRSSATSMKLFFENVLRYSFNKGFHDFQMVAAHSMENKDYTKITGINYSSLGNDPNTAYFTSGYIGDQVDDSQYSWSSMGVLTKFNYSYNSKYLFQFVGRADASSRFAKENRWGFFPSVALGWRVSEEGFMENVDWLNLKLRGTWGKNGNSRIDNYATYNILTNNSRYVYGTENTNYIYDGVSTTSVANTDIKWEATTSYNGGVDIVLFKQFFLNADVFMKTTTDMLLKVPVVRSSGFSANPYRNTGEVANKGYEFVATYKEKETKIKYEVGLNFSHYVNDVISLGDSDEPVWGPEVKSGSVNFGYVTKTQVGHPIGEFFGYVTDGVFNTDEEINASAQKGVAILGDFKFVDLNKDGVIDDADRTAIGSPHPDFSGGVSLKLNYKGLDLSAFVFGVYGSEVFNAMRYYTHGHNSSNMYQSSIGEYWNPGTDYVDDYYFPVNTNASLPKLQASDNENKNYTKASDFYVEDGSYLRLKDLQLGYTFPKKICEKIHVGNMRIYGGAQNVFTITGYSGLDPEIGKQTGTEDQNLGMGIDTGNYPQSRTFFMGINIGI